MTAPAYASGVSAEPLLGQTIGENLDSVAARLPDHEALVVPFQQVRLTYAELVGQVDRLARGLLAAGYEIGDRLALWSPNRAEWVVVQFAAAKVGAILVTVNPAYRASEMQYVLAQSGSRLLIAAPSFKSSDYRAMVAEVRDGLPALERAVFFETPEWHELRAGGDGVPPAALDERSAGLSYDDPINIQYTSGTTGFPKGATLSHHNILNNAYFAGVPCRYTEADRVCVPVPFYHCFGMVTGNLACVARGATIVVPAPSFDAKATLDAVQDERCTSLYGVPTMFIAELALPDFAAYDLSSLRTGIMGGSPCPVEVMKQCVSDMHLEEITIAYGMTETSPQATTTAPDDAIDIRVGTVGRPVPHVEIQIVDPASGRPVRRGEQGEFCTRGYNVMLGYWNDPGKTAQAIDANGWMHTGDLATMDGEGYVRIVGRIKDLIIRGGENVYPREIEEFLYGHPDVLDVQVIGVPDARLGEEIMAWIRPREGSAPTVADIAEFCGGRIAHFKVPRYVHLVDEFPMTVTGKVQKYKMREVAVELLAPGD